MLQTLLGLEKKKKKKKWGGNVRWTTSYSETKTLQCLRFLSITHVIIAHVQLYDISNRNNNLCLLGHCYHLKSLDFGLPPSSVICALCFMLSTDGTVEQQIKIRRPPVTTVPSKWTFYLSPFCTNAPFLYPLKIFVFLTFSMGIEMEKENLN